MADDSIWAPCDELVLLEERELEREELAERVVARFADLGPCDEQEAAHEERGGERQPSRAGGVREEVGKNGRGEGVGGVRACEDCGYFDDVEEVAGALSVSVSKYRVCGWSCATHDPSSLTREYMDVEELTYQAYSGVPALAATDKVRAAILGLVFRFRERLRRLEIDGLH